MGATFEETLRGEIGHLEDEMYNLAQQHERLDARIDGLRHALDLYLQSQTSEVRISGAPLPPTRKRIKQRGSRFDKVLDFVKESGMTGVTIDEMFRFTQRQGLKLKRASIRSNVWNRKKDGDLVFMGESRYRMPIPSDVVQPKQQEGSADSLSAEPSLKLVGAA